MFCTASHLFLKLGLLEKNVHGFLRWGRYHVVEVRGWLISLQKLPSDSSKIVRKKNHCLWTPVQTVHASVGYVFTKSCVLCSPPCLCCKLFFCLSFSSIDFLQQTPDLLWPTLPLLFLFFMHQCLPILHQLCHPQCLLCCSGPQALPLLSHLTSFQPLLNASSSSICLPPFLTWERRKPPPGHHCNVDWPHIHRPLSTVPSWLILKSFCHVLWQQESGFDWWAFSKTDRIFVQKL